jgi:hypothetical protein
MRKSFTESSSRTLIALSFNTIIVDGELCYKLIPSKGKELQSRGMMERWNRNIYSLFGPYSLWNLLEMHFTAIILYLMDKYVDAV